MHPRERIIQLLKQSGGKVPRKQIQEVLGIVRSTLSHHLRILRDQDQILTEGTPRNQIIMLKNGGSIRDRTSNITPVSNIEHPSPSTPPKSFREKEQDVSSNIEHNSSIEHRTSKHHEGNGGDDKPLPLPIEVELDPRLKEIMTTRKPRDKSNRKKVTDFYIKGLIIQYHESVLRGLDPTIKITYGGEN